MIPLADAVAAHQDYLLRVAFSLTHNRLDAEDLLQSMWLKVVRYWGQADDRNLRGYFRTVLKNVYIDGYRAHQVDVLSIDDSPHDEWDKAAPWSDYLVNRITLEDIVESRERFEAVKAAVQTLSPVEQRAVAMAAGHQTRRGHPGPPAAERIALHRARKHLREAV